MTFTCFDFTVDVVGLDFGAFFCRTCDGMRKLLVRIVSTMARSSRSFKIAQAGKECVAVLEKVRIRIVAREGSE